MRTYDAITCSEHAAEYVRPAFGRLLGVQECFVVVAMDARNKPIGRPRKIAIGTANSVAVHPRDVFRDAVKRNAVAIIVAHNHPSGDAEPSSDDRILTQRLAKAGAYLGIPVLDHVIVAGNTHTSFADRGEI